MDNSAAKVGQIFTEAGAAFNKLAEMTMLLHPLAESLPRQAIKLSFRTLLTLVSYNIHLSTQSKTPVKRKAPEERIPITTSGQVLNMLKAQDSEDSKALNRDIKVECELNSEDVII